MNDDQLADGYVSASLNGAIFHASVRTRDRFLGLCTPSGSNQDLKLPKKKVRYDQ